MEVKPPLDDDRIASVVHNIMAQHNSIVAINEKLINTLMLPIVVNDMDEAIANAPEPKHEYAIQNTLTRS